MKKNISTIVTTIAPIVAFVGLPASFIAAAFHPIVPQTATSSHGLLDFLASQPAELFTPVVFVAAVMSFALVVVHNLREDQRLSEFTNLHLRMSSPVVASSAPVRKPRLAIAKVG